MSDLHKNTKLDYLPRVNDLDYLKVKAVQIAKKLYFVYEVITERIVKRVLYLSQKYKFKIVGDIQSISQIGLVTKFKNSSLLCPNEKEVRIALRDKESVLEALSQNVISLTKSNILIMKLGAQVFIAYD